MQNKILVVAALILWAVPVEALRGDHISDYDQDISEIYIVEGDSVAPFGYTDGELVRVHPRTPDLGEMIAFVCHHDACDGKYIKKLIHRDGSCHWVEGRSDLWISADGRQKYSVDSTSTFGWLCGAEIEVLGVVE